MATYFTIMINVLYCANAVNVPSVFVRIKRHEYTVSHDVTVSHDDDRKEWNELNWSFVNGGRSRKVSAFLV